MCSRAHHAIAVLCLATAAAASSQELSPTVKESEDVTALGAQVTAYYSSAVSEQKDASHNELQGMNLAIWTEIYPEYTLSLSAGLKQSVDGVDQDVKMGNTYLSLSRTAFTQGAWSAAPTVTATLPTNEDDKVYLGYQGGLQVQGTISYASYNGPLGELSLGGEAGLTREFYEYDTSKYGEFNESYGYSYGPTIDWNRGDWAAAFSYTTSRSWRTDGESEPFVFGHAVELSYQATERLSLKIREGMQDRLFKYDEVTPNVRLYDQEYSQVTVSGSYTL